MLWFTLLVLSKLWNEQKFREGASYEKRNSSRRFSSARSFDQILRADFVLRRNSALCFHQILRAEANMYFWTNFALKMSSQWCGYFGLKTHVRCSLFGLSFNQTCAAFK